MSAIIISLLILVSVVLVFGVFSLNRYAWSAGLLLSAMLITMTQPVHWLFLLVLWIVIAAVELMLLHTTLRYKKISLPLLNLLQAQIPPISRTEKEALDAGDTAWESELLGGKPDWETLTQYRSYLSPEEQKFLAGPVEQLCRMLDDWQITHELHDLPEPVWEYIKQERFLAMILPKEFGGLGFSAECHSEVIVKLASRSITAAVTVMVPNSLGPGQLLIKYGTEAQKQRYLPTLVSGEDIPCFALTSPVAGSDATSIVDQGVVCRDSFEGKEDVLGIRLTWSKRYITLAPVATLLGLAFKLYDPDHLLGDAEDVGITLALIPTSTAGVNIGRRHMPGANPFQNGPNSGDNVFIPIDWIIGGVDYAGKGWSMLVECLSEGRGVSLPALSVAAAKQAVFTTTAYAMVRKQFRMPVARFEGVEEVLARIIGKTYLMNASRLLTLNMLDAEVCPSVATAIIKFHLTEMMREVINDAMDVHGGKAIMLGPKNYLMRTYQAIPISITVEGANILTRNMMIFGQGVMRCHPFLMREVELSLQGEDELEAFDSTLCQHVSHVLNVSTRAFLYGLSGFLFTGKRHAKRQINALSSALATATELALASVGGQLKKRERLSARLGDALSYLYLASATLDYFEKNNDKNDRYVFAWAIRYTTWKTQEALITLADNLPIWAGWLLRATCFPLGRYCKQPSDSLDHAVVKQVLVPSEFRDRLVAGIHIPADSDEPLAQLNKAFGLVNDVIEIERKINHAFKASRIPDRDAETAVENRVISAEEAELLQQSEVLFREIINVDDFSNEEYRGSRHDPGE